ncbi:MAG: DUF47 family protein [Microbacteriaceae bacterium]
MIRPFKRVKKFSQRGQNALLDSLNEQLSCSKRGIALALELVRDELDSNSARLQMSEIEHQGDQARLDFITLLRRSLSIPIDREDMFRVSRAIDNILDTLRDYVRLYDMFTIVGKQPVMEELLEAINDGTDNLGVAVEAMMENPRDIRRAAILAKKNKVRHIYQEAVASVVNAPLDNNSLKLLELFHKLNEVGSSVTEGADILSDGAVKRSH